MSDKPPEEIEQPSPPPAAKTVLEGTKDKPEVTPAAPPAPAPPADPVAKPTVTDQDKPTPGQSPKKRVGRWCYLHNPNEKE